MPLTNLGTGLRPGVCLSTTRPTTPYEGQMIYETDTDLTYVYGGTAWQQISGGTAVGNGGLVYIKQQTVGSAVSSVLVSSAFSATYDHYKIFYAGGTASTQNDLKLYLGSTVVTTGYYQSCLYASYGLATSMAQVSANSGNWPFSGGQDSPNVLSVELMNPFEASKTIMESSFVGAANGRVGGRSQGFYDANTSYTSFTILCGAGNISGGIVYVYGYRKA